jgi:hypothetical protein
VLEEASGSCPSCIGFFSCSQARRVDRAARHGQWSPAPPARRQSRRSGERSPLPGRAARRAIPVAKTLHFGFRRRENATGFLKSIAGWSPPLARLQRLSGRAHRHPSLQRRGFPVVRTTEPRPRRIYLDGLLDRS